MELQSLSPTPEDLLLQLQQAAKPLFYISETEIGIKVHRLTGTHSLKRFSGSELQKHFFPEEPRLKVEWARMERPDCKGYRNFFRHYLDKITQISPDQIIIRHPVEQELAEKWRRLRDLWTDHFVRQSWFKVHRQDGSRKAIFSAGQYLDISFNPDTHEILSQPGDWFVLETGTIET